MNIRAATTMRGMVTAAGASTQKKKKKSLSGITNSAMNHAVHNAVTILKKAMQVSLNLLLIVVPVAVDTATGTGSATGRGFIYETINV